MGRSNCDMSDWLIRQDDTPQFKKKTQIKYNHIYIYIYFLELNIIM